MNQRFRKPKVQAVELRPECLAALQEMQSVAAYEKGTVLFRQGQPAHGVYTLRSGRARLGLEPNCRGELFLRIAGPGYLLGLPAAISGEPYGFSARLLEDAQVGFIHRDELLPFLRANHELCLHVVQLLGNEVGAAFDLMRAVRRGEVFASRNIA
jgi:CRP/FNR family transcriptional regulator